MTSPSTNQPISKMTISELLEFSKLANVKRRVRERLAAQIKRSGVRSVVGLTCLSCKSANCEGVYQNLTRVCGRCLATYVKVGNFIQAAENRRARKNRKKLTLEVSR